MVAWAAIEAQCGSGRASSGRRASASYGCERPGLPETIPDTGDATSDLGTDYGEGMTREQIIAGMREQTILRRLASLDELSKVATFMASDGAVP